MAAKTKIAFEAKMAGIKIDSAKENAGYGASNNGKLLLTLAIEQPSPPRAPNVPYALQGGWNGTTHSLKARPADIKKKAKETDEEFQAREVGIAQAQQNYDRELEQYNHELEQHQKRLRAFHPRLMNYAQLVGIAGVFGSQVVSVVITPANQDLLPSFALALLSEEEAIAEPMPLLDASDFAAD